MSDPFPWEMPSKGAFDDAMEAAAIPKFWDPDTVGHATKQRRWEHKVVGEILKHFDLVGEAKEMVALSESRTGTKGLTFDIFRLQHPTFPVWLTSHKIYNVHLNCMEDLSRNFFKTSIYKNFAEAEAGIPDGVDAANSGLVFEWLRVWPMCIVHDYFHLPKTEGLTMLYSVPDSDSEYVAVQSFTDFLSALPWSPR